MGSLASQQASDQASTLFREALALILKSYPPYDFELYNTYILPTEQLRPRPFVPRPAPAPLTSALPYTFRFNEIGIQNESKMFNGPNSCDIYNTTFDYDLDMSSISENDIVINHRIEDYVSPFRPEISGIWRPAFLYIDHANANNRNTVITRKDLGQDNVYEAGLKLEQFITINRPILKSWTLSDGATFNIDFSIPKDSVVEASVLGLMFWYRWYETDRENKVKQTFTIVTPEQTVTDVILKAFNFNNERYKAQLIDHAYSEPEDGEEVTNVVRYGLHSGLVDGDRVIIKEKTNPHFEIYDEYIYEVKNNAEWICLGKKRFIPGLDIFIPYDDFFVSFNSEFDKQDYIDRKDGEFGSYSFPKCKINTNDYNRYIASYNSLFNIATTDNTLAKIFEVDRINANLLPGEERQRITSAYGMRSDPDFFEKGHNRYIAAKNLCKFLSTSPVDEGITHNLYANPDFNGLDLFDLYSVANLTNLKSNLENLFGKMTIESIAGSEIPELLGKDKSSEQKILKNEVKPFAFAMENHSNLTFDNGRIVATKKDLVTELFRKSTKNRYIYFPKNQKSKIVSKFNVEDAQCYIDLNFQEKMHIPINNLCPVRNAPCSCGGRAPWAPDNAASLWYKQNFNIAGFNIYTRLKVPDDAEFEDGERESLRLSYIDENGNEDKSIIHDIHILSFMDYGNLDTEFYNQAVNAIYDAYGITQKFQQKYNLERNVFFGNGEYFDILFTDQYSSPPSQVRTIKGKYYQENLTFENAVKNQADVISEYAKKNDKINRILSLIEDRFAYRPAQQKTFSPNIRQLYTNKLGGAYFKNINLFTTGRNRFWNFRTGPVPIRDTQYFTTQSIKSLVNVRDEENKKIEISFDCGNAISIELYDLSISKLRSDKLETASCVEFPNKSPLLDDSIFAYDKIIGYEYNESQYLLTTRTAPPIISYGGHRDTTISQLGLAIESHPPPISAPDQDYPNDFKIRERNTLPYTAKNSYYYINNQTELANARRQNSIDNGRGDAWNGAYIWDKSAVKCFLSPTTFNNEITFRKGFFHPNKGWIDHTLLTGDLETLKNKTAVKDLSKSICKEFSGYGTIFNNVLATDEEAKAIICAKNHKGPDNLIIKTGFKNWLGDYVNDRYELHVPPSFITIDIDENIDFITHLSVRLKNFTHTCPKDVRASLLDSLAYRHLAWNIVDDTLARLLAFSKCNSASEDKNYAEKIRAQRAKEKSSWLGQFARKRKPFPRHLLFNNTILNYVNDFEMIFDNYARNSSLFAHSSDRILPVQSLDYYIGTSGVNTGFGDYVDTNDEGEATVSSEKAKTWAVLFENLGGDEEGGTCASLQVCTGCPVPNYDSKSIYNRFDYNNEAFNIPFNTGYNFIANFRNRTHIIPPINLEAPYNTYISEYPSTNLGARVPIQLSCLPQPDPPRPREFPKVEFPPLPIFIPPAHPSIVGLLTHIAIMTSLWEQGYGFDWGAFAGIAFPNPLIAGASRREKINKYMQNKGYLQIEGTTGEALRFFNKKQDLSLYDDKPFGISDKVQLEVQYNGCLWYNIEADIFKYSQQSSPALENKKFRYIKYSEYKDSVSVSSAGGTEYIPPLNYPGFDYNISIKEETDEIVMDGARPFYSFYQNENISIVYEKIKITPTGTVVSNGTISASILEIKLDEQINFRYSTNQIVYAEKEPNSLSIGDDTEIMDEPTNKKYIEGSRTIIKLSSRIPSLGDKESYTRAYIKKQQTTNFLIFDPTVTDGIVDIKTGSVSNQIKERLTPFGKWGDIKETSLGPIVAPYIKDQLFSEGSLGWGTNLINNKPKSVIFPEPLLTLRDFDYHYGNTNYCGKIKFTKSNNPSNVHICNMKFNPRKIYDYVGHPYAKSREDEFISFTGYPRPLPIIKNRIYGHNLFSISESNANLFEFGKENKQMALYRDKNLANYYLPFYDLTLDPSILDTELLSNAPIIHTQLSPGSGTVQFENIMSVNDKVLYDSNYYWINIPNDASGVLSSSSKIPKAIIQKCDMGLGAVRYCHNVCNTQLIGPTWPNMRDDLGSSDQLIYKYPNENIPRCPDVEYEERETEQRFYMGCGETKNDSIVGMEVKQVYDVPVGTHTYISARDLFENNNEIKVRFKYIPRKIPTDFRITLGNNIVNQSQLSFWVCHKTSFSNIYNVRTIVESPPFYKVLNEMIFRSWFGERQKIGMQDTYNQTIYLQQNHYKWVPYDYDTEEDLFKEERGY
jgi:hypothetical protein